MKTRSLSVVFLVVLVDLMGFGIVLPLLPFYAERFDASTVTMGLLFSVYAVGQLIFSPVWGGYSDRVGRRPIMLLSTFGASMAYLVFGFAHSIQVLFASRIVAGIMGGNIATAQAYIADVTTEKDRSKGMGLIGAAFGIGFLMGPAIAAGLMNPRFPALVANAGFSGASVWIASNNFAVPGIFAAAMSLLSFLLVWRRLPESLDLASADRSPDFARAPRMTIFSRRFWDFVFAERRSPIAYHFPLLILSIFLITLSESSIYVAFPLLCKRVLGMSEWEVGLQYAYLGVIAILTQGIILRPLTKRLPDETIFLCGSVFIVVGLMLIPTAVAPAVLTAFLGILTVGTGLGRPTVQSLISKQVEDSEYGVTMGVAQSVSSLGRIIGPVWGGFLYGLGFRLPFWITAAVISVTVAIGLRIRGAGSS